MNKLQKTRLINPALELLAQETIDKGNTKPSQVIEAAKAIWATTNDPEVYKYTYKQMTLKKAWKFYRTKYEGGIYNGKRLFHSRESTKYAVTALTAQGYKFKFINNLDFIHNLMKVHKDIKTFDEFARIIREQDSNFIPQYGRMQIAAMLEFGHLGD